MDQIKRDAVGLRTVRAYHAVNGLAPDGLPTTCGRVKFCRFGPAQLDSFREAVRNAKVDKGQKAIRLGAIDRIEQDFTGRIVAEVEERAPDGSIAKPDALRETRLTVDVINFFTDLIDFNNAHLSLPGDADSVNSTIPSITMLDGEPRAFGIHDGIIGRIGELSLPRLREEDVDGSLGFHRACGLLSSTRNKLTERVISSLKWAGRATVERRSEQKFLLYAIALESLVLAEGDSVELAFRLRVRVAHLLGRDEEVRKQIFEDVRKPYKIRSNIVHNGHYDVGKDDLEKIRRYAKESIRRILTVSPFTEMSKLEELKDWFEARTLE